MFVCYFGMQDIIQPHTWCFLYVFCVDWGLNSKAKLAVFVSTEKSKVVLKRSNCSKFIVVVVALILLVKVPHFEIHIEKMAHFDGHLKVKQPPLEPVL